MTTSKPFSLRISRVILSDEEDKYLSKRSSLPSLTSHDESKQEKSKLQKKRTRKKETVTTADVTEKSSQKTSKHHTRLSRIEYLKKLLRKAGIRNRIKNSELDQFSSNKAKINYLKSLFATAGFTGTTLKSICFFSFLCTSLLISFSLANLTIKECEKFRKKRDIKNELLEIQETVVKVEG